MYRIFLAFFTFLCVSCGNQPTQQQVDSMTGVYIDTANFGLDTEIKLYRDKNINSNSKNSRALAQYYTVLGENNKLKAHFESTLNQALSAHPVLGPKFNKGPKSNLIKAGLVLTFVTNGDNEIRPKTTFVIYLKNLDGSTTSSTIDLNSDIAMKSKFVSIQSLTNNPDSLTPIIKEIITKQVHNTVKPWFQVK